MNSANNTAQTMTPYTDRTAGLQMEAGSQSNSVNLPSPEASSVDIADSFPSTIASKSEPQTTTIEPVSTLGPVPLVSPIELRWTLHDLGPGTYWMLMVFVDMCGLTMPQVAPNKIMTEETAADLMRRWNAGKLICEQAGKSWAEVIYEHSLKFKLPPEYLERCGMRVEAVEETNETYENDYDQTNLRQ